MNKDQLFRFHLQARLEIDLKHLTSPPAPFSLAPEPNFNKDKGPQMYFLEQKAEWLAQIHRDSVTIGQKMTRDALESLIATVSKVINKPLSLSDFTVGTVYTCEPLPQIWNPELLKHMFPDYRIERKSVDNTIVVQADGFRFTLDETVAIYDTDAKSPQEYMEVWGPKAKELAHVIKHPRFALAFQMEDRYL